MAKVIASFLMLWILILVLVLNNENGGSRSDTGREKVHSGAAFSGQWYPSGL